MKLYFSVELHFSTLYYLFAMTPKWEYVFNTRWEKERNKKQTHGFKRCLSVCYLV